MSAPKINKAIQAEISLLASHKILTYEQGQALMRRYPTSPWNLLILIRWFTLFGAIAMAAGLVILAPRLIHVEYLLEGGLLIAFVGLIFLGRWLARRRQMVKTGATLELMGAFALQGFTFALAHYHSSGSDNWPALIGIDSILLIALAYALQNRLILVFACINLFTWFGGETGYISGWGAYWLGMNYPLRFVAAGIVSLILAWGHFKTFTGPLQGFSRVWAHFGLLSIHLALWFFSLFGYFELRPHWDHNTTDRLLFSAVWAGFSVTCLLAGARMGLGILRSYGMVFLIINVYTFYFQFIAAKSAELWWIHLLLVGGSMVLLGVVLEKKLSERRSLKNAPAS
ncbi:MAG: hypothetical protein U1F57_10195 [bacterium]